MQEDCPRAIADELDAILGNPILMVCADGAKSKVLFRVDARSLEVCGIEAQVVCVVSVDLNSVRLGCSFVTQLAFQCLTACRASYEVTINEVLVMVHE